MQSICEGEAGPTPAEALRLWWRLGWISFGGTAAHLALMQDALVERRQWVSNEHFFRALSFCMLLPGPEAQQLSIYMGWLFGGVPGGLLAGTLFVLPSVVVLLLLSLVYARFGSLPCITAIFTALKPAVCSLVLLALLRLARASLSSAVQWATAAVAFVALACLHLSIPAVMLAAAALSYLGARRLAPSQAPADAKAQIKQAEPRLPKTSLLRLALAGGALWFAPMLLLFAWGRDVPFWMQLAGFFTRCAVVTLGGSYTVIPYVAHAAVMHFHWLSRAEMLDGFALSETTPGPLIIVVAFVGFMAAFHHFHGSLAMGTLALLLTVFYTFLPCYLFVFAGAQFVRHSGGGERLRPVLQGITAVVLAAMADLALFLGRAALFPSGDPGLRTLDRGALLWAVTALLLLRSGRIRVPGLLGCSAVLGLGRWLLHL